MATKIFVLLPYMGRTTEELNKARQDVLELYQTKTGEEAELVIPHGKRLTGDIEAMFAADLVIGVKYHIADPVCSIVEQAAYIYGKQVIEDKDIPEPPTEEELPPVYV